MSEGCLLSIELAVLVKKERILTDLDSTCALETTLAKHILDGRYYSVIQQFQDSSLSLPNLLDCCMDSEVDTLSQVRKLINGFVESDGSSRTLTQCLLLGVAYFEIYCQANYTGPELSNKFVEPFCPSESIHNCSTQQLECDGCYAFNIVQLPQTLLISRCILSIVADYSRASWRDGIKLDANGVILKSTVQDKPSWSSCSLSSAAWWNARATVMHLRLLQKQSYDNIPTLWKEAQDMFRVVLHQLGGLTALSNESLNLLDASLYTPSTSEQTEAVWSSVAAGLKSSVPLLPVEVKELTAQVWLEWGLCQHHFEFNDRGKKCFQKAKEMAGLVTSMSASLGRRTKHQHTDYAQLFIYAKSSLVGTPKTPAPTADPASTPVAPVAPAAGGSEVEVTVLPVATEVADSAAASDATQTEGWQHARWELGRRLVDEAQGGEEAAVREVLLDDMDGGAAENIILEGGPKFTGPVEVDKGGDLHPVDQAVILALCLDVNNSNPVDGLTNEEMTPYIERVLQQAKNWMIHSTGLLERSWLEFERRKAMDRAMLQIQALIDQHTTRLTMTQSSYASIEESAPVQDRLLYLHCIVYSAQHELKRDLAQRYLRCQVFASALNYFKELEMWDEVVTCYQLMSKPHRAELVVREQLKVRETPYMLTSLADLTGKEEFYEKAWIVSKRRFPRAKRTWAKICYDRGEFAKCCEHLDEALAVQPLVATAWYLKGIACMHLERWDDGVQAFVRCVQQDMEIGEAWANIGAIYMKQKDFAKAHSALTEALKVKRESWKIIENLMVTCMCLEKYREVVLHMNTLLDMRLKSERPVHVEELRALAEVVASETQMEALFKLRAEAAKAEAEGKAPQPIPDKVAVTALPPLAQQVETLINRITNTIKSDPVVWDILADFEYNLGRYHLQMDARVKQCRFWIAEPNWEKFAPKVEAVRDVCAQLVDAHLFKIVKKTDLYACKMLLQSALRKMEINFKDSESASIVRELIAQVEELHAAENRDRFDLR